MELCEQVKFDRLFVPKLSDQVIDLFERDGFLNLLVFIKFSRISIAILRPMLRLLNPRTHLLALLSAFEEGIINFVRRLLKLVEDNCDGSCDLHPTQLGLHHQL